MNRIRRLSKKVRATSAIAIVAMLALAVTALVEAATTLDPQNPANFSRDGQHSFTSGNVLELADTSSSEFIAFFANDSHAGSGIEGDVVATFQVR